MGASGDITNSALSLSILMVGVDVAEGQGLIGMFDGGLKFSSIK